ncbi:hypothetical protein KSS87_008803 [Heliosperma pusillum]|nr:hypothetical protein KSS87_008803 [Heliosperma pusillum]
MFSNSSSPLLILIFSFLALVFGTAFLASPASATDHIVGANKGWNPGINYTSWAHNQTFFVGDYISFRYKRYEYNVFEVNKTGYDNCTTEGAIGNWTYGKDFIQFKKPGRYYFICGTGGCSSGMKVSVVVHPLSPPPSASTTEHSADSHKHSKSIVTGVSGWLAFGLFMGLISSLHF